jgi:phosphatidylinositol 4-kinase
MKGRSHLSSSLRKGSPLYAIYLEHLLESIINIGDAQQSQSTREADIDVAAREIAQLLYPLAALMANNDLASDESLTEETTSLLRDAWFNIVVHGFTTNTDRGKTYLNELRHMAIHSKPLVTEQRGEQVESDIELNTVLRRGMSSEHEATQKKRLSALLPAKSSEIGGLSYRKVIFLQAAYLVETLRADSGNCTRALMYFLEPSMRKGEMSSVMEAITIAVIDTYLRKTLTGTNPDFSAPCVAKQLALIFSGCCYRIERVQQAAMICADRIIREVPSALCQESSLFALLELLSLMWTSCLEASIDEYEWKSSFTSSRGKVSVQLSDDYGLRQRTLANLHKKARDWVTAVTSIAPQNVKGLLQTYLSVYEDEGSYGHISLGRSFATEMGAAVPSTDQRLKAVERLPNLNINTASDFMAQYTTRQEYRYAEALPEHDAEWLRLINLNGRQWLGFSSSKAEQECRDAVTVLGHLETRVKSHKFVPIGELRDILRRAAALLCRSKGDECGIVHHLVSIPFGIFTSQSIKLGISLWLGIINENPRMQSRIMIEIAQQWETTVNRRLGIFNSRFVYVSTRRFFTVTDHTRHLDPFYVKAEFAPTDKAVLAKRQQAAHNLLEPHMRLLHFLGSHFNATRLGCPNSERSFVRLLSVTLEGLKHATGHPLAREIRLQIILFGLKMLRYSATASASERYALKDQILSAALSWFSFAPQWSFGGNRLQLKAEVQLLADVSAALQTVSKIGQNLKAASSSLQAKENLLQLLIESEQSRLNVWLYPLSASHVPTPGNTSKPPSDVSSPIPPRNISS